jgi:hypothetical protein
MRLVMFSGPVISSQVLKISLTEAKSAESLAIEIVWR